MLMLSLSFSRLQAQQSLVLNNYDGSHYNTPYCLGTYHNQHEFDVIFPAQLHDTTFQDPILYYLMWDASTTAITVTGGFADGDDGTFVVAPVTADQLTNFTPPFGAPTSPRYMRFDFTGQTLTVPANGVLWFRLNLTSGPSCSAGSGTGGSAAHTSQFQQRDVVRNQVLLPFSITGRFGAPDDPPTITCPTNITVNNDPGQCGTEVCYELPIVDDDTAMTDSIAGFTFMGTYGSHSYYVSDSASIYDSITVPADGYLVTVNDSGENAFLASATPNELLWLGGGDAANEGTFTWGTGEPFCYTNWAGGEPNNSGGNEDYINFNLGSKGLWNDGNPNASLRYIVEFGPIPTLVSGIGSGGTFPGGTTTETYTVSDASGNTANCSFTVTVNDDENPTITCPSNIIVNNDSGNCDAVVNYSVTSSDNCPGQTVAQSAGQASGTAFPIGATTNSFTVTDSSGNTANCSFTVTVNDDENPVAICPATPPVVLLDGSGSGTLAANSGTSGLNTDNCSVASETHPAVSVTCADVGVGVAAYTLTATDPSGNVDTVSCGINVQDNIAPAALCQGITVFLDGGGNGSITALAVNNGSNDACGIGSLSVSPNTFNCSNVGNNSVTLTVTDNNGNSSTCNSSVTVVDNEPPTVVCPADTTIPADTSSCSAVFSFSPPPASDNCGVADLSSDRASGSTFPTFVTPITWYVTDVNGNIDSCTFNLNVEPEPLSIVSVTSSTLGCGYGVSCFGAADGSATVAFKGGCEPYSISWSNGDNSLVTGSLGAGVYTVTVTDGLGTTTMDSVTLTEPDLLSLPVSSDSLVCQGDSTGTIDLTVTGGNNCLSYSYNWSNGETTEDLQNLIPGTYSVTVTDVSGCSAATSVDIISLPVPVVNLGNDTTGCSGTPVTLSPGSQYLTYEWNNGDTAQTIVAGSPGLYTVTVTDIFECPNSDSVLVSYYQTDDTLISPRVLPHVCIGDTLYLTADPGYVHYLWSTGDVAQRIAFTEIGGFVTVLVTDTNGCRSSDSVFVDFFNTPKPAPIITPGPFVDICDGDTVSLDVLDGYFSYDWNTGETTQTILVDSNGRYFVTVDNGFGCTGTSDTVFVINHPIPNPVIFRQNDTLFVNGLFSSYQWYENRELIPGAISSHYVPLNANWYSIGIIDSIGCTALSDFLYYNPSVSAEGSTESILGIEIFPNPTSGMLNVRAIKPIDWDVDVTVMDMYGHVVKTFRLDHLLDAVRLDLRDVTNGMYLLRLEDSKGRSAMVRFMVE